MKRLFIIIVALLAVVTSASAFVDSYTIDRSQLPAEAQAMLKEYFPKAKIGMIKVDRHLLKKTDYEVRLVNGTTIEFSNAGRWKSVDCKSREVPEGLIPKAVKRHVEKNYPDVTIVSIAKRGHGYEVGLSDAVVLSYTLLGQFKGAKILNE